MPFRENAPDPEGQFPLDAPEYIFYLLFQIDRRRNAAFEPIIEPLGLTIATWRTLSIIRRLEGCTMKVLSTYSTIDRTTLTRSVDQLVDAGLVSRSTPPTDRRKVNLAVTEAGEAIHTAVVTKLMTFNREILEPVSDEDLRDTTRTLQTTLRTLVQAPDEAEALLTYGRPFMPAKPLI